MKPSSMNFLPWQKVQEINLPREQIWVGKCLGFISKVGGIRYEECIADGRRSIDGWKSSRLAYHLNIAPIPKTPPSHKEGLVCHTCDHDWCILPAHLYLGTAKQNTADIFARNPDIHARMSANKIGNTIRRGKKASEETRQRLSLSKLGNTNKKKGKKEKAESGAHKSVAHKQHWASEAGQERRRKYSEHMRGNTRRRDSLGKMP